MTCDKWPKFKEIGTKKIKLAKVVAKEKKILARTLNIYIFIAIKLDEAVFLVAFHFSMKDIIM